jgi:prepilin-type N-terminal cleavage/methylation domain-containing protein
MRQSARNRKGFTVVELLTGMLITSILLTAVAALAFALSVASTASSSTAATQAQLRQTTVRLNDLIGTCKLLCAAAGNDLVVWRADDNADKQINLNELVYLERGDGCNLLRLCQFTAAGNPHVLLSDLTLAGTKAQLLSNYAATYTPLIPQSKNVSFAFSPAVPVTGAKCLTVSFTLTENGVDHRYESVIALRSRAANLLNATGDAMVVMDDD